MLESEARGISDDALDMLSWHISRAEFDKALQIFIERKNEIPAHRRRFYFSCIQDGLSGHKSYRRVIRTAIIMLLVNFLIQPLFSIQLLDSFAFLLPERLLYYNFFAALLPHIFNIFFVLGLIFQWCTWVMLPGKLFNRRVKLSYRAGFFVLIAIVSVYLAISLIPFAMDLPVVRSGEYLTRSISEEEMIAMVYGNVIRSNPDRKDVAAHLIEELRDKYGREYPDDIPKHYYKSEKRLFGDTNLFYLDAEDEYYEISDLQLKATAYDSDTYPIVIKYLRNSKIILQIVNE